MSHCPKIIMTGVISLACLAILPACDENEPDPMEQLRDAADQGEEAIDDLQSEGEELADKNKELQEQLAEKREAIQKTSMDQLELYSTRLESLGDRVSELPAESEQAYRMRLDEIKATTEDLKSRLSDYLENNRGQEAWNQIRASLSELKTRFDAFVSDIDSELQE